MRDRIELDLRSNATLSIEDSKLIDDIGVSTRKLYNKFICDLVLTNGLKKYELFISVTCRNPFSSPLLNVFYRIILLEEKIKRKHVFDQINIDDKVIAEIFKQILYKYNLSSSVHIKHDVGQSVLIHVLLNFLKSIYRITLDWFWVNIFRLKNKPDREVLYVDNFLYIDSFSTGELTDRYYTGYGEHLSNEEKDKIWYAPTLIGINTISQYLDLGKAINKSNNNFLIQEAWLTFSDYIYSFVFSCITPCKKIEVPGFKGYDITHFVCRAIRNEIASPSIMKAIQRFRFIRRLSLNNLKICAAIDWNENQVVDRSLNLAFRKYFPNIKVKGYQGFFQFLQYPSLRPLGFEEELGTLPSCYYIIDDIKKNTENSKFKNLKFFNAPAFRFSHLFNIRDKRTSTVPLVLVALPIIISESVNILRVVKLLATQLGTEVDFVVKYHPSYTLDAFVKLAPDYSSSCFTATTKSVSDLLPTVSALISSATSVCVEAVAVGIPVAIYGNRTGVTMNPMPESVPDDLYTIFYDISQLEDFLKISLHKSERVMIVNKLFNKVDRETTRSLFTCEDVG